MGNTVKSIPGVYVVAHNIYTPLGKTTTENFEALKSCETAVKAHQDVAISSSVLYASLFNKNETFYANSSDQYTRFERLSIASVKEAIQRSNIDVTDAKTIFILSSTKGNIGLLETEEHTAELSARISLATSAKFIASHFGFVNEPVVVSNACISGVLAIITAMRLLRTGQYDTAVVAGADVISKFVASGFESFKALSADVCRPFDRDRTGLNLGEGAGTIILSSNKEYQGNIKVLSGSVSNDANHISGPSRTGEELAYAIRQAMADSRKQPHEIDFISAHGTATVYNDEMEASAIGLAGLQNAPLNSLKANYGHTLGAAGLIESIVSIESLTQGLVLPTLGFQNLGVSQAVNVSSAAVAIKAKNFLKTASGFGGCNGAVIFGS